MSTGGAARMRACGRVRRWRPRAPRERFGVPRRARAGAAITHHTVTPSMNASAILATLLCTALAAPLAAQHAPAAHWPERAVRRDIPLGPMIRRAYAAGTRDSTGAPGARYWQQSVDYAIDATLDVTTATLRGHEHITLHNTSPDTLSALVLRLYQNYFRAEESRNDYVTDITDGMKVERLTVNGAPVALGDESAYAVDGTVATVHPAS